MNQPSTLKERILQYAQVHLGAEPEHLWAKFPRYAVLRHSENAKWFAVFLGGRRRSDRPYSIRRISRLSRLMMRFSRREM